VDPGFRVGDSQTWQPKLEHDLPEALVLSVSCLGTKGTRAQLQFLPNACPTGVVSPCPTCPAGLLYLASNGNALRHAAPMPLRRRMRKGLQATLDYTSAKAIDNASLGGRGEGTAVIAQGWLNLRGERGLSAFGQRHLLALETQYTTAIEYIFGSNRPA
jgi:trimeric autotransporter adhesin